MKELHPPLYEGPVDCVVSDPSTGSEGVWWLCGAENRRGDHEADVAVGGKIISCDAFIHEHTDRYVEGSFMMDGSVWTWKVFTGTSIVLSPLPNGMNCEIIHHMK